MIPFVVGSANHDDLYNAIYLGNSPATDVSKTPKLPFIGGPFVAGSKAVVKLPSSTSGDDLTQLCKTPRTTITAANSSNGEGIRTTLDHSGHGPLLATKSPSSLDKAPSPVLTARPQSPAPLFAIRSQSPAPLLTVRPRSPSSYIDIDTTVSSESTKPVHPTMTPLMSSSSCSNLPQVPQGIQSTTALPVSEKVLEPRLSKVKRNSYSLDNLPSSDSVSSFDLPTLHEQEEIPSTKLSPKLSPDVNKSVRNSPVAKRGASSEKVTATGRSSILPLPTIASAAGSRNSSRPTSRSNSRNASPVISRRQSRASSPVNKHDLDAELVRYYHFIS